MKLLAAALALIVSIPIAQTILFEDDFNDGNADGWYEYSTPATYQVNDSLRYEMSYFGSANVYAFSVRGDNGMTMSVEDYSVRLEMITHWPTPLAGTEVRLDADNTTSYTFYLNFTEGNCYIGRYDGPSNWTMLSPPYVFTSGLRYSVPYWIRFECEGNALRAKVWQGTTGDEPAAWLISRWDYTYLNNGCMGLATCGHPPEFDFQVEYDNVMVTSIPNALQQTTWGSIKAAMF